MTSHIDGFEEPPESDDRGSCKVPIKAMRDRLFKIHKDVARFNKELRAFHKTLLDRQGSEYGQDAQVMEAAAVELGRAEAQLEAASRWISFINDYGPISDT